MKTSIFLKRNRRKPVLIYTALLLIFSFKMNAQTGNVGIGTNSPQSKLHVNGDVRIDSLKASINASQVLVLDTVTKNLALKPYPEIQTTSVGVEYIIVRASNTRNYAVGEAIGEFSLDANRGGLTYNSTNRRIEGLRAGITYRLEGYSALRGSAVASAEVSFRFNTSDGFVGSYGGVMSANLSSDAQTTGHASAYYTPTADNSWIQLECTYESAATATHASVGFISVEETQSATATSTITQYLTSVSTSTVGDAKQGFQATDHGGWIKLDGRSISTLTAQQQIAATSLGFSGNLPDATNAYLSQNGAALGNVSGSNTKTIAQANLPNVTLGGSTSTNGNHTHTLSRRSNSDDGAYDPGDARRFESSAITSDRGVLGNFSTSTDGNHSHTITTSSINGGVAQQDLDITPRTLNVNTFVYLGN